MGNTNKSLPSWGLPVVIGVTLLVNVAAMTTTAQPWEQVTRLAVAAAALSVVSAIARLAGHSEEPPRFWTWLAGALAFSAALTAFGAALIAAVAVHQGIGLG